MSADAVTRAARALRESKDGASPDPTATRTRVLAGAVADRRRRLRVTLVLVPLAAVLLLSSAWAAVTGRIVRLWEDLSAAPDPRGAPAHAPFAPPASAVPPAPSLALPQDDVDAGPILDASPVPAASPGAPPPHPHAATDAAAGDEQDLYAAAHHAHFAAHDPAAALVAWDAYLAAYPRGRFALEARYNRGLALVRLGRTAAARTALAPFADGRYGGYRQREAHALLDVLDAGSFAP